MMLKKCNKQSSGNQDRKKLRKIKDRVRKLAKDPEVRKEAEKKGRLAYESNFTEDESSTTKNSRTTSPPLT